MNNRLRQLRIERGLNVAEKLNVTIRTISHYEAGDREPSIDVLIKLCDLYDVSADYLIGRTDY